jgi:hypothetical protein
MPKTQRAGGAFLLRYVREWSKCMRRSIQRSRQSPRRVSEPFVAGYIFFVPLGAGDTAVEHGLGDTQCSLVRYSFFPT